jgi:hypothetical protein
MTPMRFIAYFLTLLVVGTLPGVASAQPWRDAYEAGDYAKASNLLYEIVTEPGKCPQSANRPVQTQFGRGIYPNA